MALTFWQLRRVNALRAAMWENGADIPLDFAMMELAGEVGEACNVAKKIARVRYGMAGGVDDEAARRQLADELADVVICADLAAARAGINLGQAVCDKFDATSRKHGFDIRINDHMPPITPTPGGAEG